METSDIKQQTGLRTYNGFRTIAGTLKFCKPCCGFFAFTNVKRQIKPSGDKRPPSLSPDLASMTEPSAPRAF